MTLEQWTRHCAEALEAAGLWFGHGTDNARDEAAWLVLAAIGAPVNAAFEQWHRPATEAETAVIEALLNQRIQTRQPLAYLLGEAWFCGLAFEVNADVLVPRSPMAELIGGQFSPWVPQHNINRILDLCTGCGCIAVACALQFPGTPVDASDISSAALQVAQRNVARHGVSQQVQLLQSDLFAAFAGQRYSLIVSNPPYVPADVVASLPAEYQAEPALALHSPGAGLSLPLHILLQAPEFLEAEGVLICEVGESAQPLQSVLPKLPLTWIEFEHGGEGVFTIDRENLKQHRSRIEAALEKVKHVA